MLAGEFAKTLAVANFGERWRELRLAAHDGVFRSRISVTRQTLAYIYICLGFELKKK
jgi:hypothetical protein